jgi:hypothetical protein
MTKIQNKGKLFPLIKFLETRLLKNKNYFVKIFTYLFLGLLFITLWSLWIGLTDKYLVVPILNKLKYSLVFQFLEVALVILIIVYYISVYWFEKKSNKLRFILSVILAFIYVFCLNSIHWIYDTGIFGIKLPRYSYIFLLPVSLEIIFWIIIFGKYIQRQKDTEEYTGLEFDQPLKSRDDNDSYNRNQYVFSVASKLKDSFNKESSFAIGIAGNWGAGKSSFINILKEDIHIKDSNIVIIDFKPWFCKSANDIIEEFFRIYREKMSIYVPELSTKITDYSNALTNIEGIKHFAWVDFFINQFETKNVQSQYDKIQDLLKRFKIKVIVFIDDLDRLDCSEVMEVLRLIRNSANFPFTQFVVAYDKDYVIRSIEKNNISHPSEYLEKIFNLEITLPKFEERILCDELLNRIKLIFKEFDSGISDSNIKSMIYEEDYISLSNGNYNKDFNYIVPVILKTLRDVIRFTNSFKINLSPFIESSDTTKNNDENVVSIKDIDIWDYYYLELIRYGFPKVYLQLRDHPLDLLDIDKSNKNFLFKDRNQLDFKQILELENKSKEKIITLLLNKLISQENNTNTNEIWRLSNYNNYFSYRIDPETLYQTQLYDLLSNEKTLTEIEQLYKQKREEEFQGVLKNLFQDFSRSLNTLPLSVQRFRNSTDEQYFKLCDFVKKTLKSDINELRGEVIFSTFEHIRVFRTHSIECFKDFVDLCCYFLNNEIESDIRSYLPMLETLLKSKGIKMDTEITADNLGVDFLKNTLAGIYNPEIISQTINQFITELNNQEVIINTLYLSIDDLRKIQFGYLDKHMENKTKIDKVCLSLLQSCYQDQLKTFENKNETYVYDNAVNLLKEFIIAHPHENISEMVQIGDKLITVLSKWSYLFFDKVQVNEFLSDERLPNSPDLLKLREIWKS